MNKQRLFFVLLFVFGCGFVQAQTRTVLLDYYFNNEWKKSKTGVSERFHYTWEDTALSGYSKWGRIFTRAGFVLKSLDKAPTAQRLKGANVYIIADPDTQKETANPNYIQANDIVAIADWVKQGGILLLLANDSANAELPHLNNLAKVFGIRFTDTLGNHVIRNNIQAGKIMIDDGNPVFRTAKQLYLKDISVLSLAGPAVPLLVNGNEIIMATSRYGKGLVFAVGDPWIYNEYIVNDRLSSEYQNESGAADLVNWLLRQVDAVADKTEVDRWYKSKEWRNGITQALHASVDKDAFFREYHLNKELWDKAFRFISENDLANMKPGKYPIDGENVFAAITEGPNKEFDATKWETHRKYVDLQYIISGAETIGVADASKATVIKPYTPDVINYTVEGKMYTARPGEIFLFFENDAHRPNIKVAGVPTTKKLVIKIRMDG